MDAISYGLANKAGASEKKTRGTTLAEGVEGNHPNVKSRIDSLDKAFEGLTLKANQMIVNDAINIMKANAKLNAIAQTTRYKMQNMIFDDLLDMSGIDATKSTGYQHDVVLGLLSSQGGDYTVETLEETTDSLPTKLILTPEETITSKALKFGAGTTKLSLGNLPQYNLSTAEGITFEIWINPDNTVANAQCIFCNFQNGGGGLVLEANKKITFQLYLNGAYRKVQSDFPVPLNQWTHIAATYDKNLLKLYINGQLQTETFASSANMTHGGTGMVIGYNPPNEAEYFKGKVDEVRLWRRARTEEEIKNNLYNTLSPEDNNQLAGYFTFEEGSKPFVDRSPYASTSATSSGDVTFVDDGYSVLSKSIEGQYSVSRDNGTTWESIIPNTLFYFKDGISPVGNKLRLKMKFTSRTQLLNYALTWA